MKAAAAVHQPSRGTLTTGLTYWMHPMVQYAPSPLRSDLVINVVLPHFYVFAPIAYAAEGLTPYR